MPEGHSVHRLARQLDDVFAGEAVAVSSPQGRFSDGARLIDGATVVGAAAHGKQLFVEFDNSLVLRVHLGLYGAWEFGGDATFRGASSIGAPRRVGEREAYDDGAAERYAGPPEPVGQVRARLVSAHGWADLRGPSACVVATAQEAAAVRARLGPDPLGPGAPASGREEFTRRIRRSSTIVAAALMDQSVLAGVGNIYRAECLFRGAVSPWTRGVDLGGERAERLWDDVAVAMANGVRDGRIVTTCAGDRPPGGGARVRNEDAHYVYRRQGLPCRRCGTPVGLEALAGRKLYWCPGCQPGDGARR
ncbi:MAG: DNA-formamidopyrimidine glycosylase family protein [Arthrobacter sp.]|uniref:Fpg/Nei family DNA glycosylase n=1 Tax=Arthrobacter sp. TaxID=1667 RepID=UPI003480A699